MMIVTFDQAGNIHIRDGQGQAGTDSVRVITGASNGLTAQTAAVLASLLRGAYARGVNDEHARIMGIVERVVEVHGA